MRERDRVDAAFREGKLIGAEGVSHRIDAYRRYVAFLRERLSKAQDSANRNHAWYMEMVAKQGATLNELTQARQRIAALEQVVAEGNAACWDAWQERDGLKTQVAVLRKALENTRNALGQRHTCASRECAVCAAQHEAMMALAGVPQPEPTPDRMGET